MTKRRKPTEESQRTSQQDDECIPLPIQIFLWRQTSPFVRPFLGKARDLAQIEQRDACKLFERIIITNNIWGQSPSLTDAIASIDRWRLIKVSFPFVLQCSAALLNNKLIKDHNFNRLGGNEAKMMYTLQWILMNASEECADSENEAKANATNVAIAAATAASLLKPTSATGNQPITTSQASSSSNSTGQEQQQQATSGAMGPLQHHAPFTSSINPPLATRTGSASSCANQSIIIPAASAATSATAAVASPSGLNSLQMQATQPSSASVSPIGSSTPTKPLTPTNPPSSPSNYLLPISSIQMFVYHFGPIIDKLKHSDFLTSNQRLEIGAAMWEPLFNHQLPRVGCLTARVKPRLSETSQASFFSNDQFLTRKPEHLGAVLKAPTTVLVDRRRSSAAQHDPAQFGEVFLGGPTPVGQRTHADGTRAQHDDNQAKAACFNDQFEDPHEMNYATYLDIAVLRCLFISNWQESGVYWAITFLSNRIAETCYSDGNSTQIPLRPRSKSLAEFNRGDFRIVSTRNNEEEVTKQTVDSKLAKETQRRASNERSSRVRDQQSSASSRFLKVEDAETSDSGGDGSREAKSPVRRLSFSSGMQTLANQIRKTSKRVKKSDNQLTSDNLTSDSQTNNQGSNSDLRVSNMLLKSRRSSSADDLNASQISTLSLLHKQSTSQDGRTKDRQFVESNPVITVTSNAQLTEPKNKTTKVKAKKASPRKAGQQVQRRNLAPKSHQPTLRNLEKFVRSQSTPRNLHYSIFRTRKDHADQTEFAGASHYLDNEGRIDPLVVLKVLHTISQRESACSQRVCDKVISLVKKLISIGILRREFNLSRRTSQQKDLTSLLPTRQQEYRLLNENTPFILQIDLERQLNQKQQLEEAAKKVALIHKILIDIVFRLYYHLGCPNHCGFESTVDHHHQAHQTKLHSFGGKSSSNLGGGDCISEKGLRSKLKDTIELLCCHSKRNFIQYVEDIVDDRPLQQVIDILHSLLGFCRSESSAGGHSQGSTSAHNPSVQFMPTPSTSSTNLNEGLATRAVPGGSLSSTHSDTNIFENRSKQAVPLPAAQSKKVTDSIDNIVITNSFKHLITRIASINKELKLQENTSLYCDIRRLISFVRDGHNNVFRSVILSALIDCAKMMNQQQKMISHELVNQKRPGDVTRPPSDDESTCLNVANHQKRERTDASDAQDTDRVHDMYAASSSTGMPTSSSAMCQSSSVLQHQTSFGSYRQYPNGTKYGRQAATFNQQDQQHGQGTGILSLSKAKRKLEQVFGVKPGKVKGNSSQLGEDLVQTSSLCGNDQSCQNRSGNDGEVAIGTITSDEASRRASLIGHQSVNSFNENLSRSGNNFTLLPQSPLGPQLINIQRARQNQEMYAAVQVGMTNFSFMMESCAPSDFLDPALLAALLDLKSPIVVRAAIYLECANFVHRCNRGQWPPWMRMNVTMHRNSTVGIMQTGGGKHRKSSSMQRTARNNTLMYRAAGRAFYSWAEAIGSRLEELTQNELDSMKKDAILEDAETSETQMTSEPGTIGSSQVQDNQTLSEVDFFQPVVGNSASPFALKMAACQLLFEVTTFLRETYRYLPPTIVHHQAANSKLGDKMTSIYDVSRAVTANRRWSMALSSLGFGQLPATLSAISAGGGASNSGSSHLKNPTTSSISEHPERRISFILHETNDENESQEQKQQENNQDNSQPITSPLAPSVNTSEQQQDAMRKMTSGRHLSQSSASSAVVVAAATCLLRSSGVIDSQSHRRKSIKLRKTPQDKEQKDRRTKFAQDLDEELENSSISDTGVRRTDSLRSRRRVSGISEKSDTSDQRANGLQNSAHDGQHGELSGDESAGNGSCEENITGEAAERLEADESRIMSNMPWFKAISLVNSTVDCNCSHYPTCSPQCYKMHQNMCQRLITSVQSIYQDSESERDYASCIFESRLSNFINLGNQQRIPSQDSKNATGGVVRAGSDCSAHMQNHSDSDHKRKEKRLKKHQQLDSIHDDLTNASPRSRKSQNRMQSMMSFHLDSIASANEASSMMADALKALTAAKAKKRATAQRNQEEPQIVKYTRANVKSLLHCPLSSFLKGAVILPRESFVDMIRFSWNLLLEDDQQLSRTAAVGFIISAIKCPSEAAKLLLEELESKDASRKISAINKFYVIWDTRYHCWPRLEDGAFVHFKMLPPSIEFTLPSPKIAQESKPVVDPPWMPRKTSNVEEVTINQDQSVQKSFVTATKTRRKQQIEIVTKALREKCDKLREDRENYHITSVPITLYAAYEPTLGNQSTDEMDGDTGDEDAKQENRALLQMKTAQALFPSCLCQAAIVMINLLDDSRVTFEGSAVYEVANKVVWSCLVEDPALFLRYFFERLTKQNQNTIFQVLRRLIRFMPRLPSQAAYTLYNHLIGFVIHYIRSPPPESSQKLISDTLSVLCLVVPSVYGLFLKDLKQILRKEQCDHNLLITANVPSAKKIIILGSDSSEIPSQFPIEETTQFYHILVDSLEFFGIDKPKHNEYFLIDVRTNHMHNLHSYVRDYYSFKRSSPPELQLINMDPNKAFDILQKQELVNQFLEFGKVSMSLSIVKSAHMAVQRVLFLHEELMKLPTFPRKALETNFSLFRGALGHQVFSMDRIHKICWVRLIARMFELTSGFFLQLGDIHLFLNAISGIFVLHCEEASVSRLCLATFINATHQFKNIFATDGFVPIMSTIVQVYSNHQNNQLLCRSIEFVCKQFYIMHRKPFLLQLFGSVASRLNTVELMQNQASFPLSMNQPSGGSSTFVVNDPTRISPTAFFRLLQSLEKAFKDPLDILELVDVDKPLRAVDFCYQQDKEAIEILDIISLCVTVTAYASESPRSTQMLIILETVVPLYMKHLQASTSKKAGQSMGKQAHKDELQKIQSISICIRTLIVNCEGLTRNFNGPLPSIDLRSSSIRRTGPSGSKSTSSQQKGQNNSAGSPVDLYYDEPSYSGPERRRDQRGELGNRQATIVGGTHRGAKNYNSEEGEITRGEFIVPRDTLLNLVAEFLSLSTGRLVESAKKYVELHQKHASYELLDVKSHLRLAEVANSLLKFASTDPSVMACRGLTRYINEILPNTEWRQEAIRPALIMILKRLDKTFNRIAKKTWVKRSTDWEGAKQLLKGAYLTFIKHPYIVHLPHLKSLINCCQNIILSDGLQSTNPVMPSNLFHSFASNQTGVTISQSASVIPQPNPEKVSSNLLNVKAHTGTSLAPTSTNIGMQTKSAPGTAQNQSHQIPSFSAINTAATLAERLANASTSSSIVSQGFNSVTIRLIAMQLLQTGDSQTLESFIGNSMNTPEKLESSMLNLIFPMCIRVCSGAREAPKLRACDIMFILNLVLNMLAPQSASSKSCSATTNSPKSSTDTSQFILSKITTTIGSTQTGATALGIVGSSAHSAGNSHHLAHHHESLKIGFLGLKILCVCFEGQLASEWIRVSRVIRDLALSSKPSGPLWDFLDFIATYRFPVFILLVPMIKCHLAKKVRTESLTEDAAHYIQCQRLIETKIQGAPPTVCRSKSFLFVSLTAELRMLKEQLIAKRRMLIEGERQASSHASQASQANPGGMGSSSPNQFQGDGSQQGDHFTAYHRLSAAIASFANQSAQGKITPSASSSNTQQLGTSAALRGTCFAAQLATSTPITHITDKTGSKPLQSSIRLSTAKSREEARKVMNTILRRTSYPHNPPLASEDQLPTGERKNSQPPSPSTSKQDRSVDIESGKSGNQIIMDPAMLMAAFPPKRSTAEGSGILKQLIQTIDRQNQKQQTSHQQKQSYQTTTLTTTSEQDGTKTEAQSSSSLAVDERKWPPAVAPKSHQHEHPL